ncbi:MAG: catalase/peroxidase HPI [Planctomycetes bacterium]|nr:catalase/peroxidase HPI [Planctomycetota bacterium]
MRAKTTSRSYILAALLLGGVALLAGGIDRAWSAPAPEEEAHDDQPAGKCPMMAPSARNTAAGSMGNGDWWPEQLNLAILHQNHPSSNPMGDDFDYAAEFKTLDFAALKKDIAEALTTSQDWWPADFGNYGPLMIRLAWHSAGTYRTTDGRGGSSSGTIRFAPLGSWPDNANLDKARRLLWPIKKKYGRKISWADLIVLSGTVALETMGFETLGYAAGREDVWAPELDINWGSETEWLGDKRFSDDRQLANPLAASQMGLIYVNPEGPNGNPDPKLAAHDIRITFARMAMNDEETVALIAGGHTLGKCHGAAAGTNLGREPEGAPIEQQGLGWKNAFGKGNAEDTITSGLEGAWTSSPAAWSHEYFDNLFKYEWKLTKSPAGAHQWVPVDDGGAGTVPDAHVAGKFHQPFMLTTDLSLREDPIYGPISKRFRDDPKAFEAAFARAWYKLTHRDMGPVSRLLGPEVPEAQLWQDPVPAVDHPLVDAADIAALKSKILASGLTIPQLVRTAWASACTYRGSDRRGGANGARIRLAPQKDWAANEPAELAKVLGTLSTIQKDFNAGAKKVSMADLIVLGGCAAVEEAAKRGGHEVKVSFAPGRTDATDEMTDAEAFDVLEPMADGFRNYAGSSLDRPATEMLVDRAQLLTLSAPEMAVLVSGMRSMGATFGGSTHGVFTDRPGTLTSDVFVNLLDMSTVWTKAKDGSDVYEGRDRASGEVKWTATSVDLVLGSNSQLRAIAEVYASDDAQQKFVDDFAAAWSKVMNLDRYDLPASQR